jgi:hypothetical protein
MAVPAMALPPLFFWVPIAAAFVGFWTNDAWLFVVGAFQPLVDLWGLVRIRPFCQFRWAKAVFFPLIVIPSVCILAKAFLEQHVRRKHVWRGRSASRLNRATIMGNLRLGLARIING